MRPMYSITLIAVAALLLPPNTASAKAPGIAWQPCPEDATAQCATLTVPVDWSRPRGPSIALALVRRPATDPSARLGSLLVDPGGPGGSGRDFVLGTDLLGPDVRRRYDLVGVDSRGVGRSHPIRCSAELVALFPNRLPTSQQEFDQQVADNRRLRADCRTRTGPLFDHVDTLSTVRDLEALRSALGDERLNAYGRSYGSLPVMQYAQRYPARVGAMVADGIMDHSLGTARFLDTQAAAVQDAFEQFVAWCDRDTGCALHGLDTRAVWREVLARADRGDIPFPPDPSRPLYAEELVDLAAELFKLPDWATLADFLATLRSDAGPARLPAASRATSGTMSAVSPFGRPSAASTLLPFEGSTAASTVDFPLPAILCADWSLPIRDYRQLTEHVERMRRIAPDTRYSWRATSITLACMGSPEPVANPQHRLRPTGTAAPLLLLSARHDPATGHAWATNVSRQLGRDAILLTYDGSGHAVYGREACITALADRYLTTRTPSRAPAPMEDDQRQQPGQTRHC